MEQTYSDVTMVTRALKCFGDWWQGLTELRCVVAEATTGSKLGMETVISSDGNSSHWAWELGNFGAEQSTAALQENATQP